MKIVTWNMNSIRVRLPQLLQWLEQESPDVLLLQETKCQDSYFPRIQLKEVGYNSEVFGQMSYNGVAICSKLPMFDVEKGNPASKFDPQARMIAATIDGMRFLSVYVPNGEKVHAEKYEYKMGWLRNFNAHMQTLADGFVVAGGDFNIAPRDEDVYDIRKWGVGNILVSAPERQMLKDVLDGGYTDAQTMFERKREERFTWWDYRQASFQRNRGLRIDLMLLSEKAKEKAVDCAPDYVPRGWDRPSDHAPLVLTLDVEINEEGVVA